MAAVLLQPPLLAAAAIYYPKSGTRRWIPKTGRIASGESRQRQTLAFASGNGAGKQAVEDMEQYLKDLSLEYESVWDTKPACCQPWSIVLTGTLAIGASWPVFQSVPFTTFVAMAIGAWWFVFLHSYPQAYTQMIAERRKRVADGDEDTFGMEDSTK